MGLVSGGIAKHTSRVPFTGLGAERDRRQRSICQHLFCICVKFREYLRKMNTDSSNPSTEENCLKPVLFRCGSASEWLAYRLGIRAMKVLKMAKGAVS